MHERAAPVATPPWRPTTHDGVAVVVAGAVAGIDGPVRVLVDAPPGSDSDGLVTDVADRLIAAGRPTLVVPASAFLRARSVRLEHGRTDADAHRFGRYDTAALTRELLAPVAVGGSLLPALRDPVTDRSMRVPRVDLGDRGVVVLHGDLLTGLGLPADVVVRVLLGRAALARRLPPDLQWATATYEAAATDLDPGAPCAVLIRWDDPKRPAIRVVTDTTAAASAT